MLESVPEDGIEEDGKDETELAGERSEGGGPWVS